MWWQIDLRQHDAEEQSHLLVDDDIAGFEVLSADLLRCFVQGDEASRDRMLAMAGRCGFEVMACTPVKEENWVQKCSEVWEVHHPGALKLVPVTSPEEGEARGRAADEILIIPGTGFGTGHHPTTFSALELLQRDEVKALAPSRVLDVGTGNAVLALGCAALYGSRILATDIDPLALDNARDIVRLNRFEHLIELAECSVPSCESPYDLVTANIYAEVLRDLEPELRRCCRPGGLLVLSGIMEEKTSIVTEAFREGWTKLTQVQDRGWTSLLFGRIVG